MSYSHPDLPPDYIDGLNALEREFMRPELFYGLVTTDSEDGPMPSETWLDLHDPCDDATRVEDEVDKVYLVRLSAPGYLDCTDWLGPFGSENEAWIALVDAYGMDD